MAGPAAAAGLASKVLALRDEDALYRLGKDCGVDLTYCDSACEMVNDILLHHGVYHVDVTCDRSCPQPLGVTFASDMTIEAVTPNQQGDAMGLSSLVGWRLTSIDGTPIINTVVLVSVFKSKTGPTRLTIEKKTVQVSILRKELQMTQGVGLVLTQQMLIRAIVEKSPAAVCGIAKYMGFKVAKIDGHLVSEPQDLANRAHGKRHVAVTLAEVHARKRVHVSKDAAEKLGVTFGDDLSIVDVAAGSVGERAGFGKLGKKWKVVGIDGCAIASMEELVANFAGKKSCVFTLASVLATGQQVEEAASGAPAGKQNTREVTLTKKTKDEASGMIVDDKMMLRMVLPGQSPAHRAGLSDLIGWRVTMVGGKEMESREELASALDINSGLSVTITLALDNDNLPSSIVELELDTDVCMRSILAAFSRYGSVQQVFPPEPVKVIECRQCGEGNIEYETKFCPACGVKITAKPSPYTCHVVFREVDDARRALADPPKNLQRALRFYHPPRHDPAQTDPHGDPSAEESQLAKPTLLSMVNCLGFFNAYAMLDVPQDASKEEIKKAYKEKSKLYHPDRKFIVEKKGNDDRSDSPSPPPALSAYAKKEQEERESGEVFKAVCKAYKLLLDEEDRTRLDTSIEKAKSVYGRKQVSARIPSRNKSKSEADEPAASDTTAAAAPASLHHALFEGYRTGTQRTAASSKRSSVHPSFSRGYTGLQRVEHVAKEVPTDGYYDGWAEEDDEQMTNYRAFNEQLQSMLSAQPVAGEKRSRNGDYDSTAKRAKR